LPSTTLPVLTNMAPVTKALLEQGGFKVDMQSMDWQTVVARRARKEPADKGGWSAFHTYAIAVDKWRRAQGSLLAHYDILIERPGERALPWFARF